MKICLIDPPLSRPEYAGKFKRIANVLPSLGLGYIAAVLEREGFDISIIDSRPLNTQEEELVGMLKEANPQIIGITATTLSYPNACSVAKKIKDALSGVFLVLGGPHMTAIPEEAMQNSNFDIGIIGEGEYAFLELAKQIQENSLQLEKIEGVAYKENGRIKITQRAGYIDNLDKLPPPARHLYPDLKYYKPVAASYRKLPFAHMMTSRGCPFGCTFCDRKVFGNKFRARSVQNVLEEIEELKFKYGVKEIKFFDDTFTVNKERAMAICQQIIKKKLDIIWSCLSHVRCVNEELLRLMKQAGCWQIGFGLESGDPAILASMKKGMTIEDSSRAVKQAKKAGLNVRAFFVIGMPGDTLDSINRSLEFAKSLPIDIANFYNVTLYPGNELFDIASKEGTLLHRKWSQFCQLNIPDSADIAYIPKGMTEEQLRSISSVIHKRFYLRPKYIFQQIKQIRSLNDIKRYFDGFLAIAGGI